MDTSTYPNVPLAARVDFNELDRERSLFEDIAWFDKHPEREWRCRRSWCFERMTAQRRPPEFGVVWLVLHRTEVYQGLALFIPKPGNVRSVRGGGRAVRAHRRC